MTTFRYITVWRVRTRTHAAYRVVTDSDGATRTLSDIRALVFDTFKGFGEDLEYSFFTSIKSGRYVANSKLNPTGPLEVTAIAQL